MPDPNINEFPMTLRQYEEQTEMLSNPEEIGKLTLADIEQIQFDRERFLKERAQRNERLQGQGMTPQQIAALDEVERNVTIDPNDPSMKNQVLQEPQRDFSGLVEGGKQAVEGIFDLASDMVAATRSEAERAAWKQGVNQRRFDARMEQIETFGQLPGNVSEILGQTAPWLLASSGQAANVATFIARNTMLGALGAASHVQPEDMRLFDRAQDVAFGAPLGALFGTVFAAPNIVRRMGARSIVRAFNDLDSQQRELVEKLVQDMTGSFDEAGNFVPNENFKFSAAQLTGSRFYTNLELRGADKATKARQNENLDILINHIHKRAQNLSGRGMTPGQIAAEMKNTLQTARDSIYAQAANTWGRSANAIVESYGDEIVIDGGQYLQKIDDLIRVETDALQNMGAKPAKALKRYREEVDHIVNPVHVVEDGDKVFLVDRTDPSLTRRILAPTKKEALQIAHRDAANANSVRGPDADQILRMVKGLNRLIGGETAVFENVTAGNNRNLGRALMGALTAEMEAAGSNPSAVRAINLLRQGYKQDMAVAQAIDQSVFSSIFGGRKVPKNPGKALDMVMRGEPAQLRQMRQFLEEWNPDLLAQMQREGLKRVTLRAGARPGAAHVDGAVDLNKLADGLADGFKREGRFGSGLFDPATQRDIQNTAEALRVLANKQFKGIVPGGTQVEEWSINLISRSPEFAGRFITRLFASGRSLEEKLLNPEWRHALRVLAEKDINTDVGRSAILYLAREWATYNERAKNEIANEQAMQDAQTFSQDPARRGTVQ